jgi:hypothetical protein
VSRVQYSQSPPLTEEPFDRPVTDNIYLLVGKRENIPVRDFATDPTLKAADFGIASTDEQRAEMKEGINWLLGDSRWIVIGWQSGRIATIENAAVDPLDVINDPAPPFVAAEGTEFMRARQIVAAREFTRTSSQVGGR